jgi:hypothetical protein
MNFYTRKWVKPQDLNAHGTLFGGSLLSWIDEEAAIYSIIQLGHTFWQDLADADCTGQEQDHTQDHTNR